MLRGVLLFVVMVSVDVPDPPDESVTLVGFKDTVGPLVTMGETAAVKLTVPAKPPKLLRVSANVAELPCSMVSEVGLVMRLKSLVTVMVMVTE